MFTIRCSHTLPSSVLCLAVLFSVLVALDCQLISGLDDEQGTSFSSFFFLNSSPKCFLRSGIPPWVVDLYEYLNTIDYSRFPMRTPPQHRYGIKANVKLIRRERERKKWPFSLIRPGPFHQPPPYWSLLLLIVHTSWLKAERRRRSTVHMTTSLLRMYV